MGQLLVPTMRYWMPYGVLCLRRAKNPPRWSIASCITPYRDLSFAALTSLVSWALIIQEANIWLAFHEIFCIPCSIEMGGYVGFWLKGSLKACSCIMLVFGMIKVPANHSAHTHQQRSSRPVMQPFVDLHTHTISITALLFGNEAVVRTYAPREWVLAVKHHPADRS